METIMTEKNGGLAAVHAAANSSTSAAAIEANRQPRAEATAAEPAPAPQPAAQPVAANAVADERTRSKKILGSDAAKGREALAQHLAFNTDMSAEDAIATLEVSPKAEARPGSRLDAAMANFQPRIETVEGEAGAEQRTAGLHAALVRQIKKLGKEPIVRH
jgi:hypothetical protein